jgi:hypothetical protein
LLQRVAASAAPTDPCVLFQPPRNAASVGGDEPVRGKFDQQQNRQSIEDGNDDSPGKLMPQEAVNRESA